MTELARTLNGAALARGCRSSPCVYVHAARVLRSSTRRGDQMNRLAYIVALIVIGLGLCAGTAGRAEAQTVEQLEAGACRQRRRDRPPSRTGASA